MNWSFAENQGQWTAQVVTTCYLSGGSGSDEETDITEQQDKEQVAKKVQEVSEDDNDEDDNDDDDDNDEDESESLTAVSALTVGDLIEVMKAKTKAKAATSQPSSVVNQF